MTEVVLTTVTGSNSSLNASTTDGVAVTEYAGPAPAVGSGPHRYLLPLPAGALYLTHVLLATSL